MPITEAGARRLAYALLDPNVPELTITLAASLIMRAVELDELAVKKNLRNAVAFGTHPTAETTPHAK